MCDVEKNNRFSMQFLNGLKIMSLYLFIESTLVNIWTVEVGESRVGGEGAVVNDPV